MPRSPSIHLALPGDLAERVPAAAEEDGLTVTAWVQRAIRRDLGESDHPIQPPEAFCVTPCPRGNPDCYVLSRAACEGCGR
jgi:hypothetical protein